MDFAGNSSLREFIDRERVGVYTVRHKRRLQEFVRDFHELKLNWEAKVKNKAGEEAEVKQGKEEEVYIKRH